MTEASLKDADHKIKSILQKELGRSISTEEFIECRQSLIKLGKAIARWHHLTGRKENG